MGFPGDLGGPDVSTREGKAGHLGGRWNKSPFSARWSSRPCRAKGWAMGWYRIAKETKRGGMDGRKSERPSSTGEAGELTRRTRWREGGRREDGTVGGKDGGYTGT